MYLLFVIVSVLLIMLARNIIRKWINPCTVYIVIWWIALSLHDLNLIYYNDMKKITYLYIIAYECFICFGIMIGNKYKFVLGRKNIYYQVSNENDFDYTQLDKLIYATAIFAACAIIPNIMMILVKYGFSGIISNMADIYAARESGEMDYVNYFAPMIYVSLVLMSIRIKKGGMKFCFIFVIVLAILNALSFGGRNNVMYTVLAILLPFLVNNDNRNKKMKVVKTNKFNRKRKRVVGVVIILCVVILYKINMQRALATVIPNNISPLMKSLVTKNYSIYKTVQYISEPISYLDVYLDNSYFKFGVNTFYFWYKQMNKIGFNFPILTTLPFYNVPMQCNVGTYITELRIDFSWFGLFIAFFFGLILGISYRRFRLDDTDILAALLMTIFYIALILSFFMWHIRSTTIWLFVLYSIFVSLVWNRFCRHKHRLEQQL